MNKPKVIYRVEIKVSTYYKLSFKFDDIRDAEYLIDAILLSLDKENSDPVSAYIYPELPEVEETETEVPGNE